MRVSPKSTERVRKWRIAQKEKDVDAYYAKNRKTKNARYTRLRKELIVLRGGVCIDCGAVDNPDVKDGRLEFDHVVPSEKSFVVTKKINSFRFSRVKKEAKKCVLRCVPCHKKRTFGERNLLAF